MTLWYVDNSLGTGSNNGTSWANAWHDFNVISWGSIAAGDTLYISGGSSSQTYSAYILQPGASGGSGNPITITAGIDAGHSGTVIIDGSTTTSIYSSTAEVLVTGGITNLVISNLTMQNGLENNLFITGVASGTVLVNNCTIHQNTGAVSLTTNATTAAGNGVLHFASVPSVIYTNAAAAQFAIIDTTTSGAIVPAVYTTAGTSTSLTISPTNAALVNNGDTILVGYNARGIRIVSNTGGTIEIKNCTLDTANNSPAQTDNIFTGINSSGCTLKIHDNTIICNNIDPSEHDDNLQIQQDAAAIFFYNNQCSHPNGGVNNHGLIINDVPTGTTYEIYNNTFTNGYNASLGAEAVPEYAMFLETLDTGSWAGTCNIYNNTVYGGSTSVIVFYEPGSVHANWVVKNNIFIPTPTTNYAYYFATSGITATIDYNMTGPALTNVANINGTAYNFAGWQGQGYDTHGVAPGNPEFVSGFPTENYNLTSTSPAINAGTTLTIASPDIVGTTRPQGTAYCLGAYEYVPNQTVTFIGTPGYPDWIAPR